MTRQSRYEASEKGKQARRAARRRYDSKELWLGVDGEGEGRNPHRYTLLAVSDARQAFTRCVSSHWLSTVDCLEFLLGLPQKAKLFAYSFRYDLTLILKDLPDDILYRLMRPELRQGKRGPMPVLWEDYKLNLVGTKFTVAKCSRRCRVWDIFKFFQSSFVNALKDWQIPEDASERKIVLDRMQEMKDARGDFENVDNAKIQAYCLEECACLAQLAKKLTQAHETAGFELTNYYGAGSTAAAVLSQFGVEYARDPGPIAMQQAVASAFFGGRFENSILGAVAGPVYSYDISSAYPYQLTQLPCLMHARWVHTVNRIDLDGARQAIVRYRLADSKHPWGPFPFREADGTISYPAESGGGWVYLPEYLQGERQFSGVQFVEAWYMRQECQCKPLFARIPELYRERVRIGKEGPGIVIKLGMNSCYGKLAQSVGKPKYQSWLWAGMITSGCRAQILELLGLHQDPNNMLMVATDGVYSLERLITPIPCDTGTSDIGEMKNAQWIKKELGGWETKVINKGVFAARPGVYFPLNPTDDELKEVRARGVGKGLMLDQWPSVVAAYESGPVQCQQCDNPGWHAHLSKVPRFIGAITGTHLAQGKAVRGDTYGQWVDREIMLSLNPAPKRSLVDGRLELRRFPGLESVPYENALSEEATELKLTETEESEQPQ